MFDRMVWGCVGFQGIHTIQMVPKSALQRPDIPLSAICVHFNCQRVSTHFTDGKVAVAYETICGYLTKV